MRTRHEGAGIATKDILQTPSGRKWCAARELYRTSRWQRTAVHIETKKATHKRIARTTPVHIVSAYAESGLGNNRTIRRERFLAMLFEDCEALGDQPVLICIDANTEVSSSENLTAALADKWIDVAETFASGGEGPGLTYNKSGDGTWQGEEGK